MKAKTTRKSTKAQQEAVKAEALARNKRRRHIYSVVLFALGLLLIAFSFIGDAGADEKSVWDLIHMFLRGVFGLSVFFIGPAMIYASVMISSNKQGDKAAVLIKMLQLTAIILLVSGAVQILFIGEVGGIAETYEMGTMLKGGGIIGMILGYPLLLFGRVGAGIIVVLIAFVFIMLMGNIGLDSFLRFAAKPFTSLGKYFKQQSELRKQDAQYLAEEREKLIKENESQAKYERMKAAERGIEEELAALEALPANPANAMPPTYILPTASFHEADSANSENSENEPPFDIETVNSEGAEIKGENLQNPVSEAIENYQKEEDDEAIAQEQRENSLEPDSVSNDLPNANETPEPRKSDFEALAAFAAHQQMYSLPGIELLDDNIKKRPESDVQAELEANSLKLIETLKSFGVLTKIVGVVRGPSVTRYEIQPAPGVKISKITSLTDDIALNLAAAGVRMEAPIPGKSAVGVEVPNHAVDTVTIRELVDSNDFRETGSNLGAVIGKAISGEIIISDIAKMPHLLIAGTTGSGKSVCVNSIIMSILYRATPEEVRLMMIDPKLVEFGIYSGIPHLLTPVVTDPKKAAGALKWAVNEMTQRYTLFAENNVRDIGGYNEVVKDIEARNGESSLEPMAKIVIFIDELADLMMTAAREVEESICRLAQLARAAGIHLVIATQRPTVNVVTGLIKANIPSRIALKVASQVDSRTIIDTAGADKLLGKGDMLYAPVGMPKPVRVQGCWVSVKEIERVVGFVKDSFDFEYDENVIEEIERQALAVADKDSKGSDLGEEFDLDDDKLEDAIEAVIDAGKASTSYLQLKLKLGYGRAARLIDVMEKMGVVGKSAGSSRPREVLMTRQDWLERKLREQ
ncbi:MAG: DNA translocase FtsK [Oscillospiraceae bacterium]|nr:DNA translocase FtsK [Oscillospiraceae bacterium]